jgi:hypothetical protein
MEGAALRASLAMVLRVTGGMIGALASLAPEPTAIVTAAPPFDPVGAVVARPGTPVLLPGCMPELPPEPVMTDGVRMAVPSDPPMGSVMMTGKGLIRRT